MKVTPDIIREEFIGTEGRIIQSPNAGYIGISGQVMDETKGTFVIQQKGCMKRVIKESSVFNFQFSDGTVVEIEGKLLMGKPEDRLKKIVKRLW
jgi:ribonuclease P protein subunit POP4